MSTHYTETIPTDSIVIGRKVMGGSSSTLSGEVGEAISQSGIDASHASIRETGGFCVDLVGRNEYANRKLGHPILQLWSTKKLVDDYNTDTQNTALTEHMYDVGLGKTEYNNLREGKIAIGFMLTDEFRTKMLRERKEAIDVLLDSTDIGPTDGIRRWRMEDEDSLWLPVVTLETTDPLIDDMAETLCDALESTTFNSAIDVFDAKARSIVVDVHIPQK